jgi:hypothetical protein
MAGPVPEIMDIHLYILLSHHQDAGQNQDVKITDRSSEKYDTVQIFGNNCNKSKFYSGGNMQDYNFACGSLWVLNLVSDVKGGTK